MSFTGVLIDSDAFLLLAGAGLLDRAVAALGLAPEAARRLPALEAQITRGRKLRARWPAGPLEKALLACRRIPPVREQPAVEIHQSLLEVDAIDDGEALLYALLSGRPAFALVSGDKRAMKAVATDARLSEIRAAVAGRVVCLEWIVRSMLEDLGLDPICRHLDPVLAMNETLGIVFSPGARQSPGQARAGLDSYLAELRSQVGDGFLFAG